MAEPRTGTCTPWAVTDDVCADSPVLAEGFDAGLLAKALQTASDVLYDFTRRRWPGTCTEVVRPCGYRTPVAWGRDGYTWCGCNTRRTCSCRALSELRLPLGPVVSVEEVKIDGVVLDEARYRVDDYRWLVYLPESDSAERRGWPCCQRLDLADSEADTWSVAYGYGTGPPPGGVQAAATLGEQLALGWCPSTADKCRLPRRVTSVARQGVTMAVVDPLTLFRDGLTGLATVDLWVAAANRGGARRASVWRPDSPGPRHRRVAT
jgi:hypothetical protein